MKSFVVDASVVLKTILNESDVVVNKFSKILEDARDKKVSLSSSKLLDLEVGNGLRFALKDKNEAVNAFRIFCHLPIKTLVLTDVQKENAISTSIDLGTTVYDTSYHILAKAKNAVFLTCDEEYFKKAKELGDIEFISSK